MTSFVAKTKFVECLRCYTFILSSVIILASSLQVARGSATTLAPRRISSGIPDTCLAQANKSIENCTDWEDYSACCRVDDGGCHDSSIDVRYLSGTRLIRRKCIRSGFHSWEECCDGCFARGDTTISYPVESCDQIPACRIYYFESECKSISGRGGPNLGGKTGGKGGNGKDETDGLSSRTRIVAFCVSGVVMVALLGFAAHSISRTRTSASNMRFAPSNGSSMRGSGRRASSAGENGPGGGGEGSLSANGSGQYYYQMGVNGNGSTRLMNGRFFIRSQLSIIQEEDDGVAIVEQVPQRQLADESYDDDRSSSATPSLSPQSACSSGAYHQVYGGCYDDDDDDEVMRIEIDERDVMPSCTSDYDEDEVVVVHRERCDSSSSDELPSLPSSLMGGYELTSMSMYDVTHTSPVAGRPRHHLHHHHASMPDMNEASHVIPDIDVILHSPSSSSVTSSARTSQYSVG